MNWWTVAGTGALGLVIGWLVWEFVNRIQALELKALSTLAAIVGGGAALLVWRFAQNKALPDEANSYFVGVFVSVLILGLLKYRPAP
jgi:hypothetical protein